MKRRTFVLLGMVAATSVIALEVGDSSDEDAIAMVVRRRLDYLKLDPEGLRRFSRDLAAKHVISSAKFHLLSGIRPVYTRYPLSSGSNRLAYLLRHGEDRIVSNYLISTDFFIKGSDETRVVQYLGLIDSRRACGNPFARPPAG
jgi:hypothetical protein